MNAEIRTISLTRGQFAIVDDEDFQELNKYKWFAIKNRNGDFYAVRKKKTEKGQKTIRMHRIIMNAPKYLLVDHRDHNTLDNRKNNLRICTNSENSMNQKIRNGCSSKYKGVCWFKPYKNWMGYITVNGKTIFLGYFEDEDKAARAYNVASRKYHGEHGLQNIIEGQIRNDI